MIPRRILILTVLASVVTAAVGCGEKQRVVVMSSVNGQVMLNGTPLQDGVVSMEASATGFAASAKLDGDGKFVIDKVPTGSYQISVNPPELAPPGETLPPRPATYGPLRKIPAKYNVLATSGLTATVGPEGLTGLVLELN